MSFAVSGCSFPAMDQTRYEKSQADWAPPESVEAETLTRTDFSHHHNQAQEFQSRGLNLQDFLAYDLQDPLERSKRAEIAILELQDQVQALQMELAKQKQDHKMAVPQHSMKPHPSSQPSSARHHEMAAHATPQTLHSNTHMNTAAKSMAPSKPAQSVGQQPAKMAKLDGPLGVKSIRVGEHSDRTRVVFDLNGAVSYSYDLDNAENLLVIEMPSVAWNTRDSQSFKKSPLVVGYNSYPGPNNGTTFVLQLKKQTKVLKESLLKPTAVNPHHRLMIDLAKN